MPLCTVCSVNMTVAELTARPYDGVAGNYHRDCGYLAYLEAKAQSFNDPDLKGLATTHKTKLIHKKDGTAGEY